MKWKKYVLNYTKVLKFLHITVDYYHLFIYYGVSVIGWSKVRHHSLKNGCALIGWYKVIHQSKKLEHSQSAPPIQANENRSSCLAVQYNII